MEYELIIIGGGPAGITAGIYAARYRLNILLITKEFGGQLSKKSVPIENYPGFPDISGIDLINKLKEHLGKFNIETADIKRHKSLFKLYNAEADSQLAEKNYQAAYDNLLKMSHNFNILDTRGAIGVGERANVFRKMQHLSKQIATLYLKERKDLNYPLLKDENNG